MSGDLWGDDLDGAARRMAELRRRSNAIAFMMALVGLVAVGAFVAWAVL